jgi:hypothetical protein
MVGDGIISRFVNDIFPPKQLKNPSNSYEPLTRWASSISQSIAKAEEKTVSALATTEPTDQLGRVLQQVAILIRGGNDGVPDIRGRELEIAQAVFDARKLILNAEKGVLGIAKFPVIEKPIRQIAEGRLNTIDLQANMSPPLKSPDTLTAEDVVQIGRDSLTKAGGEIKAAFNFLELTAEPEEIPPILLALAKAINPSRKPFNEREFLERLSENSDTGRIPKPYFKNNMKEILPGIPGEMGITNLSLNPTARLGNLTEDRNTRTSGNVTSD